MKLNDEVKKPEGVVSWVYPDASSDGAPLPATVHPKPPCYHGNLFRNLEGRQDMHREAVDVELNAELLPGVVLVEDILDLYEAAVGIVHRPTTIKAQEEILWRAVTGDAILARTQRWAELVKDLVEGPLYRVEAGPSDARSPSTSDFVDLTDSEHSVDSDPVPSTPKPRSYASVTSPSVFEFSPPRPISLSASASAFVPTSTPAKVSHFPIPAFALNITPSPSPPLETFTFPTLPPTLKKDAQGFYTEIAPSPSLSGSRAAQRAMACASSHLPSFLTEPSHRNTRGKSSKTRELVEQLRSASAGDVDRPFSIAGTSTPVRPVSTPLQMDLFGERSIPSDAFQASTEHENGEDFHEEGDGWLRGDLTDRNEYGPEAKARRTRNLVHALGRKRGDSESTHEEAGSTTHAVSDSLGAKQSNSSSAAQDAHEISVYAPSSPTPRRRSSRHRSRKSHRSNGGSSVSSPAVPPPMPLPLTSVPPLPTGPLPIVPNQPYFAPPYPTYTSSPYVFSATAPGPGFKPVPMHMQMPAPPYYGAPYHAIPPYGGMGMYGPLPHPAIMQMQPVAAFGRVAQW
ncbi:hypothetical protein FIBSPDRAFT_123905 [Athelia psychrophila]|uniref:Uncharacterized protein n=1 Tax=Athelia psychrophila TaxID=1759441 RepID=A0A165XVR8_9AGAM|nr:hypothetical protein FIBSPDRAFT_251276 [Fibularhizoctonia sp. CBS 109695]KZP13712.1 hypothetical protein FIBSPDRAFT_123905 [Fibularhizoctonia sp. CBS 109695]